MKGRHITVDANEAVASVAYRGHEVVVVHPVTPATPMAELCDGWAAAGRTNLWGEVPEVTAMQSAGGVAGALRGALEAGALATTFTASPGLLTMIPEMYRLAGALIPCVVHVASRAVTTHALSVYGDHSDVMAVRSTGFALLASGSPQEAQDFALVAQAAALGSRLPFLHFFDGFRTSHQMAKIEELGDGALRAMLDDEAVVAHRQRALRPERPTVRGTVQGPDVFFQAREASNRFYDACPRIVEQLFERFAELTGRAYRLFDYHGHPQAERVIVLMGSGAETAHETVDHLVEKGEKVGVVKVRLFRPFSVAAFAAALPPTARAIAVLDRTKEPGAVGEPLYLDVAAALAGGAGEGPRVVGGRYGLASKEFPPAAVKAVFDEIGGASPRSSFTVGISDDLTGTSLEVDPAFDVELSDVVRAVFFGLGSDGAVAAGKRSLQIVADQTRLHVQGHFVYDLRKLGASTVSHLRFSPQRIRSSHLIRRAGFVACHHVDLLDRPGLLEVAEPGAVFLLNAPWPAEEAWERLPREVQEEIVARDLRFYVIDAGAMAREARLGGSVGPVMQTCFFALSGMLSEEDAVRCIKGALEDSYSQRPVVLRLKSAAVDRALEHLRQVEVPAAATAAERRRPAAPGDAPSLVREMLAGRGDALPVSAFPVDGVWPVGNGRWAQRALASLIPIWQPEVCIQCNQCAFACPHSAIRAKVFEPTQLEGAPPGFRTAAYQGHELAGLAYVLQVVPDDCTGCGLCVEVCPARDRANPRQKAINMTPLDGRRAAERQLFAYFRQLPELARERLPRLDAKTSQLLEPLFEASSACAGCGQTPYLKLLTQLFGERLLIANAAGCSSVYGGQVPATPYSANGEGHGPAWSSSPAEDAAELGLGFRLAIDAQLHGAQSLLIELAPRIGEQLVEEILSFEGTGDAAMVAQRRRLAALRQRLAEIDQPTARRLEAVADALAPRSVWLVGGDGWACDTGAAGLEHVLAAQRNVNVLVLDNEISANTGGQWTKSTPLGAAAKFAAAGREVPKHDLGLEVARCGRVYVARVAFGANMHQTVDALREADAFPGPSLVIAYSHCVAHGYDLALGPFQQKKAVGSGAWPLFRCDPRRAEAGEPVFHLDSPAPTERVADYMRAETRFRMVERLDAERFKGFLAETEKQVAERFELFRKLAESVGEDQ